MYMPIEQHITAVLFSLILVGVTIQLIRKHRLREEYALGWLGISIIILLLSLFGSLVTLLASFFAVTYPPTLVLVLGLLSAMLILLSQSVVLTTQANHIRDLAQSMALLEWRLRQCEMAQETAVSPNHQQQKRQNNHESAG